MQEFGRKPLPIRLLAMVLGVAMVVSAVAGPAAPRLLVGAAPAQTSITIDGSFADWGSVLANSANVVTDSVGAADPDNPPTNDRDMTKAGFTWDNTYLYFYVRRNVGGTNQNALDVYLDLDNDGKMQSTDKIANFTWSGAAAKWTSSVANYAPVNPFGDTLTGDGVDMPGSAGPFTTLESNVQGGISSGLELETRITWTALGLSAGAPLRIHISLAQGAGTNVPSQITDNAGNLSTQYAGISFTPNGSGGAAKGSSVSYAHTLTNNGNWSDTFTLSSSGSRPGWTVTFSQSSVTLAAGASTIITVTLAIPANEVNGALDQTTVRVVSSYDSTVSASVVDSTGVGQVSVTPNRTASSAANQVVAYSHTVANVGSQADTMTLSAGSSRGWAVQTYVGGSPAGTLAVPANGTAAIEVRVTVPAGAATGIQDTTTVTATSQFGGGSKYGTATDSTTVAPRLAVGPNNTGTTGENTQLTYSHLITNAATTTDTVSLSASSDHGWTVRIFDGDTGTPTSSVAVGPYGGSKIVLVSVNVPAGTAENTVDVTTLTATSGIAPILAPTATETTTVRKLATYRDSARSVWSESYVAGDVVYARGTGLGSTTNVYFEWIDGNAATVRTKPASNVTSDADGLALDEYTTTEISPTTNITWTVKVRRQSNDAELASVTFYVRVPDHVKATASTSTQTVGNNAGATVQIVDAAGTALGVARIVTVTVGGSAVINATSLSGPTGLGTNTVSGTTNSSGNATVTVYDTVAETVTITPTSALSGSPAQDETASIAFTAAVPNLMEKVSGDNQVTNSSGTFASSMVVRLRDVYSNVVPSRAVDWTVTSTPSDEGSGTTFSPGAATTTNVSGLASTTPTFPAGKEGRYQVVASSGTLSQTFSATLATLAATWSYAVPSGLPVLSSPVVLDGVAYIGADDGHVYAVNATSLSGQAVGTLRWKYPSADDSTGVGAPIRTFMELFYDDAPSVDQAVLYAAANNGHVYALKLGDGLTEGQRLLWDATVASGTELTAPIIGWAVTVAGYGTVNVLYVGSSNGHLYGLRSTDGAVILDANLGSAVRSTPAVLSDYLWVGTDGGIAYRLRVTDLATLNAVNTGASPVRSSPFVDYVDHLTTYASVFVGTNGGTFTSLNAYTGNANWTQTATGAISASPWRDVFTSSGLGFGTNVFFVTEDKKVYVVSAADGSMVSGAPFAPPVNDTSGAFTSSPVAVPPGGDGNQSERYVYFGGTDGLFYATKVSSPGSNYRKLHDSLAEGTSGAFSSSPALSDDLSTVVVGSANGRIYGFPVQ